MKIGHVSITVKSMEESIRFYVEIMGLELKNRLEVPENKSELAFLSDKQSDTMLELTYWKEKKDWNKGDELDHLGFNVPNMDEAMKFFRKNNVEITKEPYVFEGTKALIAFIADPNGILLEIIERK